MMQVLEIPGQTADAKALLATNFGVEFSGEPPFVDSPPTHTVTLEGAAEKRAALSGILACDHTHPELLIVEEARIILLGLRSHPNTHDRFTFNPSHEIDERLMASMYWAAHYAKNVGSLTLASIADRDPRTAQFASFIGDQDNFDAGLELLQQRVDSMEEAGIFNDVNPDHVHNLPLPKPRPVSQRFISGSGYHLHR